ncbi:MAG: ribose-phosphate pyrophosphokinase [Acidobacteriia bacterium]|nr:ribose-phosphate pyrophosphokinase [Methyloceanibacter sp.]MCL6490746.1 ribose-phosphate pyrophosphokinase [Terriglobia bacterium]
MSPRPLSLFALSTTRPFGEKVAAWLEVPLAPLEEREFEDGEHKARPLQDVSGQDVFVLHALYGEPGHSVNDKLCRLLFFCGALKDAGAERVTAVLPYLAYARKDRRTKARDPITTRYVAAMCEAVGIDRVIVVEVHNVAAFENAFRCPTIHLEAAPLFAEYFASLLRDQPIAVVSPDPGGAKRAEQLRERLEALTGREVASAYVEKFRSSGVVTGSWLAGDVRGKTVIIVDDLISTGTTLIRAAKACRAQGAGRLFAAAAHGLFIGGAPSFFEETAFEGIVVLNTVPPFRLASQTAGVKLTVLDAAGMIAQAILGSRDIR